MTWLADRILENLKFEITFTDTNDAFCPGLCFILTPHEQASIFEKDACTSLLRPEKLSFQPKSGGRHLFDGYLMPGYFVREQTDLTILAYGIF